MTGTPTVPHRYVCQLIHVPFKFRRRTDFQWTRRTRSMIWNSDILKYSFSAAHHPYDNNANGDNSLVSCHPLPCRRCIHRLLSAQPPQVRYVSAHCLRILSQALQYTGCTTSRTRSDIRRVRGAYRRSR